MALDCCAAEIAAAGDESSVVASGLEEHPYLPANFDCLVVELRRLHARCVVVVEGKVIFKPGISRFMRWGGEGKDA